MNVKLLLPLLLAPGLAFGAATQVKKSNTTAVKTAPAKAVPAKNDTVLSGSSSTGLGLNRDSLKGLSIGVKFDLNDSLSTSNKDVDTERGLQLAAQYEFNQFSPGIAAQIGTTYDFDKTVKNSNGLKYSNIVPYAELTAKMTPELKAMGGLNYSFPSMKNAADGASIKGKIGFQIGAAYAFNDKFAVDARYRSLEMETTGDQADEFGQVTKVTSSLKATGFVLGASYLF